MWLLLLMWLLWHRNDNCIKLIVVGEQHVGVMVRRVLLLLLLDVVVSQGNTSLLLECFDVQQQGRIVRQAFFFFDVGCCVESGVFGRKNHHVLDTTEWNMLSQVFDWGSLDSGGYRIQIRSWDNFSGVCRVGLSNIGAINLPPNIMISPYQCTSCC